MPPVPRFVELTLPEDADDDRNGSEKRIAPRYRVLGHAQIIGPAGATNCVIRDLSESGAKLGVSQRVKLPREFTLWLVQRKMKLRVRLRWRHGDYVGVSFLEPQPHFKTPASDGDSRFILDV